MRSLSTMAAALLCTVHLAAQTEVLRREPSRIGGLWHTALKDPQGRVLEEATFSDSLMRRPHGFIRRYHPNGRPMSEVFFLNGRPEGPARNWYPAGGLLDSANALKGKRNGIYRRWYADGTLQSEGSYFEGLATGLWRGYHPDGSMASEAEYERGEVVWVRYRTLQGEVLEDVPNVLIHRTPETLFFDAYLEPEPELRYASYFGKVEALPNGIYRVALHDFTGTLSAILHFSSAAFRNKSGPYVRYDGEGRIRVTADFRGNLLHGELRRYHANGRIADSGSLRNGEMQGVWRSWYPTGLRKDSGEYRQGLRSGFWQEWEESSGVRAVGFYHRGGRRGDWKHYDRNGRILYVNRNRTKAVRRQERVDIGIE